MTFLLDVNVLIALCYEEHAHNFRVRFWLKDMEEQGRCVGLATCSITELGFVRIAAGPAGFAANARVAIDDLARLKAERKFTFVDDIFGAAALPSWVVGFRQVTDGHLLQLAAFHREKLATLDRGIPGALLIPAHQQDPSAVREPTMRYDGMIYTAE